MHRSASTGLLIRAVLALVLLNPSTRAQSQTEFEVASVKPNRDSNGVRGGCHGVDSGPAASDIAALVPRGRCVITAGRLSHIMSIAYELHEVSRVIGESSLPWGNERFDIEAKAESASATQRQLLTMLQSLIADRFKLKTHRETKSLKGFELVVARNGHKLKPATADANPSLVVRGASVNKSDARDGKGKDLNSLTARGRTMAELAAGLMNLPGFEAVVDRTGLTGAYDFQVQWEPEEDLNSAFQQQLGLRLQAAQVPVEFIVIDSAQRPGEN